MRFSLVMALLVAAPAAAAPVSVLQDDVLTRQSSPTVREAALDDMASLGVDRVRVLVVWRDVAPRPRSRTRPTAVAKATVLARFAELQAAIERRGMRMLPVLTGPIPLWASRCRPAGSTCRPDPAMFRRFSAAAGRALPGQRAWAIWNEPNAGTWLTPQRAGGRLVSPRLYRRLVRAGVAGLRASGHGSDTVLIGETAPIRHSGGAPRTRPVPPGTFARRLLCRGCASLGASGFAHHLYPNGTRPLRCRRSPPGEFGADALRGMRALVRRRAGLPLWITESGVQTDPPDVLYGVPLAEQARQINQLEWLATKAGVRSVAQFMLVDEQPSFGFQSGLRFLDGRAKPSLAAYRLPVWVAGDRLWARLRGGDKGMVMTIEQRRDGRWRVVRRVRGPVAEMRVAGDGPWRVRAAGATSRVARPARACPLATGA